MCFYLLWVSQELVREANWDAWDHADIVHPLLEFFPHIKGLGTHLYSKIFPWFLITCWVESKFLSLASKTLHNMAPTMITLTVPFCPLTMYPQNHIQPTTPLFLLAFEYFTFSSWNSIILLSLAYPLSKSLLDLLILKDPADM